MCDDVLYRHIVGFLQNSCDLFMYTQVVRKLLCYYSSHTVIFYAARCSSDTSCRIIRRGLGGDTVNTDVITRNNRLSPARSSESGRATLREKGHDGEREERPGIFN